MGERGGDGREKGLEEGGKKWEGKGREGERKRGRRGGTCSKVLGGIDAPGCRNGESGKGTKRKGIREEDGKWRGST